MKKPSNGKTLVNAHLQCKSCMSLKKTDELLVLPAGVPSKTKLISAWTVCPLCQGAIDEEYIHVIEVSNPPSGGGHLDVRDLKRTGKRALIPTDMFTDMFETPPPADGVMFCGPNVMSALIEVVEKLHAEYGDTSDTEDNRIIH